MPDRLPGIRRLSADFAVLATIATVASLFLVSPMLLEHFGINYLTPGGNPLSKLHPATYLAVMAVSARCLATRHPLRTMWRLFTEERGVVMLIAAIGVMVLTAAVITKTPITPLADTFVLPILCLVLLRGLDEAIMKSLAILLIVILCANACLGIFEMVFQWHLVKIDVPAGVTSDPTRIDAVFDWHAEALNDWRAMALLGHPLVNGLIAGAFIVCLVAPGSKWLPLAIRMPIALLQLVAMFAFGARASLVIALALVAVLALKPLRDMLVGDARLKPQAAAAAMLALVIVIAGVVVLNETGFFDRMIRRFADDAGSAQSRYTMFEMFRSITWDDLVLAPSQDVVATWQRLNGLEFGIESSWIGLILTYGLVVTGMTCLGLAAFAATIMKRCGRGSAFVLLFLFISVSGTTSLSGKTTSLAMTEVLVLLLVRKDKPSGATRSATLSKLPHNLIPALSTPRSVVLPQG